MRQAEIATALAVIAFAIVCMIYASDLPIGWVPDSGPGGGAFPFWLSGVMLAGAVLVLLRELAGRGRFSAVAAPFMTREATIWTGAVAGLLIAAVASIHVVGMYVAIPTLLLVYLRGFGRHRWRLILPLVLLTPVGMFFFFEVALRILLPKGITEPWFVPLYAAFM